ncbi:unnamed protein product [Protopolystoma xenopodis]|uniref:Uncharacterized protein n=1 Tax=Protopolystoma xenopodis TaxID=117903 RepID=A0A3S5ASF5_9PLAT|nr:unnamed protein product [Protopolystoma xenopodis]
MAKSKRSKVKRHFRALRRIKRIPFELNRLKKIESINLSSLSMPSVNQKIIDEQCESKDVNPYSSDPLKSLENPQIKARLQNEHGNYPIWMNKKDRRRIISLKKRRRKKIRSKRR